MLGDGLVEQELGAVVVGEPERGGRESVSRRSMSETRTPSSKAILPSSTHRAPARDPSALPAAHERPDRAAPRPGDDRGPRVGARGGRDGRRRERARSRSRLRSASTRRPFAFRAASSVSRSRTAVRGSSGRRSASAEPKIRSAAPILGGCASGSLFLSLPVWGLAAALPAGGYPATNAGWQTFTVATGGFSVQLPSTWVDVSSASPAVLKKLESNPALQSARRRAERDESVEVARRRLRQRLGLHGCQRRPGRRDDVADDREVVSNGDPQGLSGLGCGTGGAGEAAGAARPTCCRRRSARARRGKVAIIEYLLLKGGVLYAVEYSAPAATRAHYTKTFTRSARSFRLLPPV